MHRCLFISGIVGAIILFVWCAFSWMVLPWHKATLSHFLNDRAVTRVIDENAPTSGVYILGPKMGEKNQEKKDSNSTFMFASINKQGMYKNAAPFIGGFIIQFLAAFGVSWLLSRTVGLRYGKKVAFVSVFGLIAGVLCALPGWNWWGIPAGYTIVMLLDVWIGWTLAGLAMAKLCHCKKK